MAVLNPDVLYTIFDALRLPPASFYRDAVFKDTRFYRAMIAVGLSPPLPTGDNLFSCTLVCRAWRGPAQYVMRRHLQIKTGAQCRHIISVTSNPDVGRGVHSLDFIPSAGTRRKFYGITCSDVVALLGNCPNLRMLRVNGSIFTHKVMMALVDSKTVFSYLAALDLGWGSTFEKSTLGPFFDTMPRLRVLGIGDIHDTPENDDDPATPPPSCRLQAIVPYKLSFHHYQWLLASSKDTLSFLSPVPMWYQSDGSDSLRTALRTCGAVEWLSFDTMHHASMFIEHCPRVVHLRLPLDNHLFDATYLAEAFDALASSISSLTVCGDPTLKAEHVRWLIESIANKPVLSQLKSLGLELRLDKTYTALPVGDIQLLQELCNGRGIGFRCPDLQALASGTVEFDNDSYGMSLPPSWFQHSYNEING